MDRRTWNVLFLCTGNSARSVLAEALLNQAGSGRFKAWSAGSHPTGAVNPAALETLRDAGAPTAGLRSKNWSEFAVPGAPPMDIVITVCDNAAGEICPIWPGRPATAHWGLPDPAAVTGNEAAVRAAFAATAVALKRRIELMLALPLPALDTASIEHGLRDIAGR